MTSKNFKRVYYKYPVMVSVFTVIFFISCTSAGPLSSNKNYYDKFIDYLNKNQCSMPNEIELPFPEPQGSWQFLSTPLKECQLLDTVKPDEEVFMLCSEVFESLTNITCSNASVILPKIQAKLSSKVCEDFGHLGAFIPKKENYLGERLVDHVVCKIICGGTFQSLCSTLLWSYDVQKQIADAQRNEKSMIKYEENNNDLNEALPQDKNKLPENVQVVNDEHMKSHLEANDEVVLPNNEIDNDMKSKPEQQLIQGDDVNGKEKSMREQLGSSKANSDTQGVSDNEHEAPHILPRVGIKITNFTKGDSETQSKVTQAKNIQKTGKQLADADSSIKLNKTSPKIEAKLDEQEGKANVHNVPANNVDEEKKTQPLPPKINDDSPPDIEQNEIKDIDAHEKKNSGDKQNNDSAKGNVEVPDQPTNMKDKTVGAPNFRSSSTLNVKPSDNITQPSTKEISQLSKETITASKASSAIDHVSDSALIQDSNAQSHKATEPNLTILSSASAETDSKLIPGSTTIEALLENMEIGNEENQHPDKDLEQYNDLENNEGEEGEYARSDYDGGFNQLSKNKDPATKSVGGVASVHESVDEMQNRDDVFAIKNSVGRVPDDIQMNPSFPDQEDGHFFFYFLSIVLILMAGYLIFHNKQKIIALIVEGRHERRRRSHGVGYKKLETK